MAVAPSFQKYPTYGDPYEKNGRQYIRIVYPDGHHREVRWYTDAEYAKMYPDTKSAATVNPLVTTGLKEALGFHEGYITIFKGDTYPVLEWFRQQKACRFHSWFGWYVVSREEVPQPVPAGVEPVKLYWTDVAISDTEGLKSEAQVRAHLDTLLYEASTSEYQGSVGERIDRTLTVAKAIVNDTGYYGPSTFYLFLDEAGNEYCWTTAAKQLEVGEIYEVRGTIKQLSMYKGKKQTILTRCKVN